MSTPTVNLDFFERQAAARRHTKLLEVYFALAVACIIAAVYIAIWFLWVWANARGHHQVYSLGATPDFWNPRLFLGVSAGTIFFIFCGSAWKMSQLSGGGSAVAELLGGIPINPATTDPDERKLLNVVEEMAIASGTPVPQVFVLPGESGINAFAAGHSTSDMVICTTRGCLKSLTRDELQGVIGHEFSHILNGDMRLNLRLMGVVFGILCLALFGRILLNTQGRRNPLPLLGIALLAIGGIGVFFGKLIKSAINRQREFLADASSVQFTRNPEGLAGALKKVGGCGSRIDDPNAEDASHFFFANGLTESFAGLFSTHPPLETRIRALEPNWDGKFTTPREWVDLARAEDLRAHPPVAAMRPVRPPQLGDLLGGRAMGRAAFPMNTAASAVILQAGAPVPRHLEYAADLRASLPDMLTAAAREPMSAVSLIFALLLSQDDSLRAQQLAQLEKQAATGIASEAGRLFDAAAQFDGRARLPLVSLAMGSLRRLSPSQYEQFSANLRYLIESDQQIDLFEFMLQKIVTRQLDPVFNPAAKRPVVQYYVLKPLLPDAQLLLSALARAGQSDPPAIEKAFLQGAAVLNITNLQVLPESATSLDQVDAALTRLNQAAPQIKKQILTACAETAAADGIIQEYEAELLRAIADTLDCPIPPLISL